jgi:predicted nucleic acid-binding protein
MAAQKKRLSLDANFLFDLAEEEDFAHDLLEALQRKGYGLALPPTVAHELHIIFTRGDSEAERELARMTLSLARRPWPFPSFFP